MNERGDNWNDVLAGMDLRHRNDVLTATTVQRRNDVLSFAPERCPGGPHLAPPRPLPPLGGYLRTTAFNLARSGIRRRVVALPHRPAPMHDVASAEAAVVLREDQREVAAALRRLPTRQRECIVLRCWADQTESEIAATLGVSVNSVKTHLRRGMEALEVVTRAGS